MKFMNESYARMGVQGSPISLLRTIKQVAVALTTAIVVAGCGGSGSSSGGQVATPTPTPRQPLEARFTGTYSTNLYNGSLDITVSETNGVGGVTFGGLTCLGTRVQLTFSYNAETGTVILSGQLPGRFNQGGISAFIRMDFPENGGSGTIDLDAGQPCRSTVGTIQVTRQ